MILEDPVDQWFNKYDPLKNQFDDNASWNGYMFETFDEEVEFVRKQADNLVWTWVDGEGGTFLLPGPHFVNRIGYFVCRKPWRNQSQEIQVEAFEEECK